MRDARVRPRGTANVFDMEVGTLRELLWLHKFIGNSPHSLGLRPISGGTSEVGKSNALLKIV